MFTSSSYESFGDSRRSGTTISVAQTHEGLMLLNFGGKSLSEEGFALIKSRGGGTKESTVDN